MQIVTVSFRIKGPVSKYDNSLHPFIILCIKKVCYEYYLKVFVSCGCIPNFLMHVASPGQIRHPTGPASNNARSPLMRGGP